MMKDDVAVASGQLYYKAGAFKWEPIGESFTTMDFSQSIDLCTAGISDGEFTLALEVTDKAGNVSKMESAITLEKQYECPAEPPVCTPSSNEVALYSDPGFQGKCQLLAVGDYPNMSELPKVSADQARSIQVGAAVTALLYPDANFAGAEEIFQDGDDNLGNNAIGSANAASVKVIARQLTPQPVVIALPAAISSGTDLIITWSLEEGVETRASLTGPADYLNVLDWQTGGSWQVGKLEKGKYILMVEARNAVGIASTTQDFTVSRQNMPLKHIWSTCRRAARPLRSS